MTTNEQGVPLVTGLRERLAATAQRLSSIAERPRFEADLLWGHVLGLGRAGLIAADDSVVTPEHMATVESLIERRCQGEPMAYLLGHCGFWSLDLAVTPDTLIPRPETEGLVEWALSIVPTNEPWRIADLGTGSGAIALAIACERPHARVFATDVSAAALAVARGNADRLALRNVELRSGNWFRALPPGSVCDLIVSNPPYVAEGDPHLADLRFEPGTALTSGADGLDAIRSLVQGAPSHLRSGAWLLMEHGFSQAASIRRLLVDTGFESVETRLDLAGHERLTGGRRP